MSILALLAFGGGAPGGAIPVTSETDTSAGPTCHMAVIPPMVFLEQVAPMNHPPGKLATHKLTNTVRYNGLRIAQEGHDLGPALPHPPNPWGILAAKSSRKIGYAASKVKADAKPLACSSAELKLLVCGDVTMPWAANQSNSLHTVFVGMTAEDQLCGQIDMFATQVVDTLMLMKIAVAPAAVATEFTFQGLGKDALGVEPEKAGATYFTSLAAGVAKSALSNWERPVVATTSVGGGYAVASVEVSYDVKKRTLTKTYSATTGGYAVKNTEEVRDVGAVEAGTTFHNPLPGYGGKTTVDPVTPGENPWKSL